MKPVTTILFVENDAVALTMYQKRLQREGFHVEIAEDGIAALRVLSEMTPDIVILDLMLPKFSGRDVFDYMRADTQFRKIPVIIFSNAPRTEWPLDMEASPTRALPKSEADFSSLLQLVREMTAAATAAEGIPAIPPPADASASSAAAQASAPALTARPAPETGDVPDNFSSAETVDQFLEYVTADMSVLREHCLAFIKGPNTDPGRSNLSMLRKRLQTLAAGAQKTNCARLALLANAWEMLLAEIERKPSIASPSILQTLAQAADCLRILLSNGRTSSMEPVPKAKVLSVDDDEICNHVAISALEKANMDADSVIDANAALELLKDRDYDMVLLDINMPVLTGFELCEKLRAMPHHQKTPVIFVTAYNNFENRKQSVLSGGGDLIAKPVSPLELALKVTIHLLKAPPKTVTAAKADAKPEPALVWKEPVETISHDTEIRQKNALAANGGSNTAIPAAQPRAATPEPAKIPAPRFEMPKTEAAKIQPAKVELPKNQAPVIQPPKIEQPKVQAPKVAPPKIEAPKIEPPKIPAPKIEPPTIQMPKAPAPKVETVQAKTAKIESVKVEAPKIETAAPTVPLKSDATKALAAALQSATPAPTIPAPAPAPAAQKPAAKAPEHKPISASVTPSPSFSEKNKVAPTQPSRTTQPAAALSSGSSSKPSKPMTKETNQQFETLVLDVANIIFGENAPDINVRLVRMALEQVWQNRANLESVDSVAREIARIIFGENSASELNTRLVRMALERSNSISLFKAA